MRRMGGFSRVGLGPIYAKIIQIQIIRSDLVENHKVRADVGFRCHLFSGEMNCTL